MSLMAAAAIGGSLFSANQSTKAANAASAASAAASAASIAEQKRQYDQTRQDQQPFMNSGYNSMNALNSRLGLAQFAQNADGSQYQAQSPQSWEQYQTANPGIPAGGAQGGYTGGWQGGDNGGQSWVETSPAHGGTPGATREDYDAYVNQYNTDNPSNPAIAAQAGTGQQQGGPEMYGQFQGGQQPIPQYSNNSEALPQFQNDSNFEFDLEADAGYNFARDEAIKSASRTAAGQGGYNSGNRLAEISDRVTGVASQYADQAYNRQLSTSQENFGRDVNRYGMDTNRNNTNYSRNLTDYGVEKDANATQYNRDLTEYGLDVSRNTDMYGRDQTYLNRLAAMSGMGQTAVNNTGVVGANSANNISSYLQNNGTSQANAAYLQANGNNNAVQGGIENWLTYQQTKAKPAGQINDGGGGE